MKKRQLLWLDFLAKHHCEKALSKYLEELDWQAIRLEAKKELENALLNTKHADIIMLEYVKMRGFLSEDNLLKIFALPNAAKIFTHLRNNQLPASVLLEMLDYSEMIDIVKNYVEWKPAPDNIFDLPNYRKLILFYAQYGCFKNFSEEAQVKLVTMPDSEELISAFHKMGDLSETAQLKMFEQPNASALVKAYIRSPRHDCLHELKESAELKMLDLPNAEELLDLYGYKLCDAAELKMFDLPNAENIVRKYLQDVAELSPAAEAKLFDLPNAEDILKEYLVDNFLDDENEALLLNLPNGINMMKEYMQNCQLGQNALAVFFEHPASQELLKVAAATQKFSPELQLLLLKRRDAVELITSYIEREELSEEAQLMLFDLPYETSVRLFHLYAVKQKFCQKVMQRLAVISCFSFC